jgi:signal peptidase I
MIESTPAGIPSTRRRPQGRRVRLRLVLLLLASWLPFRSIVADLNEVSGSSMEPALLGGDWVAVNRLAYGLHIPGTSWYLLNWNAPARGEVVIFYDPITGRRLVKRVVGLPGDRIEIRGGYVFLNGEAIGQGSLDGAVLRTAAKRVVVPAGHYFVLGDNRPHSRDSRSFGAVDQGRIVGRVGCVTLSFESKNLLVPRWQRFLTQPAKEG